MMKTLKSRLKIALMVVAFVSATLEAEHKPWWRIQTMLHTTAGVAGTIEAYRFGFIPTAVTCLNDSCFGPNNPYLPPGADLFFFVYNSSCAMVLIGAVLACSHGVCHAANALLQKQSDATDPDDSQLPSSH